MTQQRPLRSETKIAGPTCSCLGLQGFQTALVDLLVELSTQACVTADSDSYLHGYPNDSLVEQLPKLPASIVDYLMTANMHPLHKQYFVQHAFLPCARNFVEEAHQAMVHWEADAAKTRLVFLPAALTLMLGTARTKLLPCCARRPQHQATSLWLTLMILHRACTIQRCKARCVA